MSETMGVDFQFRDKIPVAILGATGAVGQKFVELLHDHPWFEIVALAASERSAGRVYSECAKWILPTPLPNKIGQMTVQAVDAPLPKALVFSALDASIAGEVEERFAKEGYTVISNSRNHRRGADVPLLIPEVNPDHLELLKQQKWPGKIVTNPNCSATGLVIALKPLDDTFGIEKVFVATLQAVSGAGYPGVASLDILDNVIPHISGEEEKLESEPLKILGKLQDGKIEPADISFSAHCNRVPVIDGHLERVSIKLRRQASLDEIKEAFKSFSSLPQTYKLPSAPLQPIHFFDDPYYPQPRLHRNLDKGMAVSIGQLRPCALLDYKFALLSHNTVRGAAGSAILNAELMVKQGFIFW